MASTKRERQLTIVTVCRRGNQQQEDPCIENDKTRVLEPSTGVEEGIDFTCSATAGSDDSTSHFCTWRMKMGGEMLGCDEEERDSRLRR